MLYPYVVALKSLAQKLLRFSVTMPQRIAMSSARFCNNVFVDSRRRRPHGSLFFVHEQTGVVCILTKAVSVQLVYQVVSAIVSEMFACPA